MKQRQTALILPGLFLSFSVAVIARIMALAVPKLGSNPCYFIRNHFRKYTVQARTLSSRDEGCGKSALGIFGGFAGLYRHFPDHQ